MLDPWIIEEIRRRERDKQNQGDAVVIEAPVPDYHRTPPMPEAEENPRGVVVIDL